MAKLLSNLGMSLFLLFFCGLSSGNPVVPRQQISPPCCTSMEAGVEAARQQAAGAIPVVLTKTQKLLPHFLPWGFLFVCLFFSFHHGSAWLEEDSAQFGDKCKGVSGTVWSLHHPC